MTNNLPFDNADSSTITAEGEERERRRNKGRREWRRWKEMTWTSLSYIDFDCIEINNHMLCLSQYF